MVAKLPTQKCILGCHNHSRFGLLRRVGSLHLLSGTVALLIPHDASSMGASNGGSLGTSALLCQASSAHYIGLPIFARFLGFNDAATTTTLAVLSDAAVFGCILVGILIDRYHVTTVVMISTTGVVISVLILWGLATSIPLLFIFSATHGFRRKSLI